MRILIVYDENHADNLFVPTLKSALSSLGLDVTCSVDEFWNSKEYYDVIHLQWPEELIGWTFQSESRLCDIQDRFDYLKELGCKFIYTRHNSVPHYQSDILKSAYLLFERISDLIVHMGEYSMNEIKSIYPQKLHIVIPHHIYEGYYNDSVSRDESINRLSIPNGNIVITAFGKFRNKKEILMTLFSFIGIKSFKIRLLAPRMLPVGLGILTPLVLKLLNMLGIYTSTNATIVPNEDLPYYFSAADIVFIQRINILNSGNVPMAFMFKKIVVGPDVGNVGEMLRITGNPVFTPHSIRSVVKAIREAINLIPSKKGIQNYKYAKDNMNLSVVGNMYKTAYLMLVNNE